MRYLMAVLTIVSVASFAPAAMIGWQVPIASDQVVGAPAIPGDEPTGVGIVWLNDATNELTWEIPYSGLSGDLTNSHFHGPAARGVNAGVQVPIEAGPLPKYGILSGAAVISDAQEIQLLDGLWYINIHTALNGGGEIRGQIDGANIIPEPATLGLIVVGGLVAVVRRRRR